MQYTIIHYNYNYIVVKDHRAKQIITCFSLNFLTIKSVISKPHGYTRSYEGQPTDTTEPLSHPITAYTTLTRYRHSLAAERRAVTDKNGMITRTDWLLTLNYLHICQPYLASYNWEKNFNSC